MAIDGRAPQPRPLLLLRARVRRPRNRNIRHVRRAIGYVRHRRSDDLGPHRARAGLLAAHRRLHIVWPATAFFPEDSDGSGRRTQISTWRSSSGRCANSSVRRTDSSSRGMHVRATHARDISRPKLGPGPVEYDPTEYGGFASQRLHIFVITLSDNVSHSGVRLIAPLPSASNLF